MTYLSQENQLASQPFQFKCDRILSIFLVTTAFLGNVVADQTISQVRICEARHYSLDSMFEAVKLHLIP